MKKSLMLLFLVISMVLLSFNAAASPWKPYDHYIPAEMLISKRHLRGMWISTVLNLDWPSKETVDIEDSRERIEKSKEELISLLDMAAGMNINAIFFQVSPEGDALYKSDLVPWSRYLTGTFGQDPGFDPLEFVTEQAHIRNMELHAWVNPYRVSMYTNTDTAASLNIPKSVYKEHPEWIRKAMSRYVIDPGIPEARKWVMDRVMEIVEKYDIDGIHFDDYFYYERTFGELDDKQTYMKYNPDGFSNIKDWRRNNTYILIKELSEKIRASKSWVKFGISPLGIWANQKDGYPDGSNTRSSVTNYDSAFADTKRWVEEELIDYIAPQVYFTFANSNASYGELTTWWADVVKGKNVHLYIGQALYKINDDSDRYFKGNNALKEFSNQLKYNVAQPRIMGSILFRAKNFTDSGKQQVVAAIKKDLWSTKSLIPVMPWKGGRTPDMPIWGKVETVSNGTKITWDNNEPNTCYYAVYRFGNDEAIMYDSNITAKNLIALIRKEHGQTAEFIDKKVKNPEKVKYMITALDRLHNESKGRIIAAGQSAYFLDVGLDFSWAVNAIDELFERKIVLGNGNGMFFPSENTKRKDFIIMVVRAFGLDAEWESNFIDVPGDAYYHNEAGIAKKLGLMPGNDENFYPEENIVREEMIVILLRAIAESGYNFEITSEDILRQYKDEGEISGYARAAVASMIKSGYIEGSNGYIRPKGLATRAEIAVILQRILNLND